MLSGWNRSSDAARDRSKTKPKAVVACEGLEGRQLLTHGFGGVPSSMAMRMGGSGGSAGGNPSMMVSNHLHADASQTPTGDGGWSGGAWHGNGANAASLPFMQGHGSQNVQASSVQTPGGSGRVGGGFRGPDRGFGRPGGGLDFGLPFLMDAGRRGGPDMQGQTAQAPNGQAPPAIPAAVQTAIKTLQTDVKAARDATGSTIHHPTHASLGAVMDDHEAVAAGTLTGDAATAKIKADEAAVLQSAGFSADQITKIQADKQALDDALKAAGIDPTNPKPPVDVTTTATAVTPTTTTADTALTPADVVAIATPARATTTATPTTMVMPGTPVSARPFATSGGPRAFAAGHFARGRQGQMGQMSQAPLNNHAATDGIQTAGGRSATFATRASRVRG